MATTLSSETLQAAGAALLRGEQPEHEVSFPFAWGPCWHFVTEYAVDDLSRELGFFSEVLGFRLFARDEGYAMLASPDEKAFLGLRQATPTLPAVPAASTKVGLLLDDIVGTARELEGRGVSFDLPPAPWAEGAPMLRGEFRTPHGVTVELWGMVAQPEAAASPASEEETPS